MLHHPTEGNHGDPSPTPDLFTAGFCFAGHSGRPHASKDTIYRGLKKEVEDRSVIRAAS
jgi:hypothetical protein